MSTIALGKYELQQQIGHNSIAEVWKAFDVQLRRPVAIRILHPQEDANFIAHFEREAQLIASLHHPNIVKLHDFQIVTAEPGGTTAYMVMDYIEGPTLGRYIDDTSRQGNIPRPSEIVQLFTSIALAVDYAHMHHMVHRALNPANILLDRQNTTNNPAGEPILTDFGVAKLIGTSATTFTGTQFGTPQYISPEQVKGYAGNELSDIYALGIMLYEVVTGVLPFQGDDPTTVMAQHLNADVPSPRRFNPNIPPALELVILKCLSKEPTARFSSASSLAVAIAEALNVPVPARLGKLGKPVYPADAVDMPTYLTPAPSTLPDLTRQGTPSSPALPPVEISASSSNVPSYPPRAASVDTQQRTPMTPTSIGPSTSGYGLQQNTPSTSLSQPGFANSGLVSTPPTLPTRTPGDAPPVPYTPIGLLRRRKGMLFVYLALIILLIGGSVGAFLLYARTTSHTPVALNPIVGHAFFVSSGQLNDGAQGIADELQVDLQNVQPPPSGKSYYLWLLPDKDTTPKADLLVPPPIHPPLLLTNNLPVQNNSVHYMYSGDAQHNNLLSDTSRLLITVEDAGRSPASPSPVPANWVYYAELPQAFIPGDPTHLRGLDHIRHLYYNENHLPVLALYGGLDIWVFRNVEKVLEWSTSARDDFNGTTDNYTLMHNLFISILDYLDGIPNVHVDVPAGTPVFADPAIAKVSLLTVDTTRQGQAQYLNSDPPGDLDHLVLHLSELVKAPDASATLRQLAQSILVDIGNAKGWLQQVRMDTKQLFAMSPDQLSQPAAQSLLDDLVTQATFAYIGKLDATSNTVVPGVLQAHYDVQKLATFDISTHVPKSL